MKEKKQAKKIKIRIPYYSAVFFLFLILYDRSVYTMITFGAALLHEIGHAIAAGICGVGITEITVYPFGADMKLTDPLRSYRKDIVISAAGAGINLLAAAFAYFLPFGEIAEWIITCNLTLAATNLFPVEGLDGGGILRGVICCFSDGERADAAVRTVSFFGLFVMWLAAVYILFVTDGNPSLFIIVCALFSSVFLRGRYRGKNE